jgi:hypothetical protein
MKTRIVLVTALLLASVQALADSKTERHWHLAQVREIQRTSNHDDARYDHWEYIVLSDTFVYTIRNGSKDAPYLNGSLGAQVKIASVNGSDKPYDGDDVLNERAGTPHGTGQRSHCRRWL